MKHYSTELFSHDRQSKMLLVDASELRLDKFDLLDNGRPGVALRNPHKGTMSFWEVVERKTSNDGDVMYWDLSMLNPQDRLQESYVMRIFND